MSVTRKSLANMLCIDAGRIRQHGAKQLFSVYMPDTLYLYSYRTCVGKMVQGTWYITTAYYSVTTSRQINWFISYCNMSIVRVDSLKDI